MAHKCDKSITATLFRPCFPRRGETGFNHGISLATIIDDRGTKLLSGSDGDDVQYYQIEDVVGTYTLLTLNILLDSSPTPLV